MTQKPTSASKTNCSSGNNDPKKALLEDLPDLIDKFNQLLNYLGTAAEQDAGQNALNIPQLSSSGKLTTAILPLANQTTAQSGANNATLMTPLRTKQAIDSFVPANKLTSMQFFTVNGTFTVPAGVTQIRVWVYGATAADTATNATTSFGSEVTALHGTRGWNGGVATGGDINIKGGSYTGTVHVPNVFIHSFSAGGFAIKTITTTPGTQYVVTIGQGYYRGYIIVEWVAP